MEAPPCYLNSQEVKALRRWVQSQPKHRVGKDRREQRSWREMGRREGKGERPEEGKEKNTLQVKEGRKGVLSLSQRTQVGPQHLHSSWNACNSSPKGRNTLPLASVGIRHARGGTETVKQNTHGGVGGGGTSGQLNLSKINLPDHFPT